MTKKLRTNWWLLLIVGIIFLALAYKVMTHPTESIIGLALFIGWASFIAGIFQVIFSLSSKNIIKNWTWRMFSGIINIVVGIVFLTHPVLTSEILPLFFGFWMVFVGISTFFNGVSEQSRKITGSWFDKLLGLIIFLGGILISYYPTQEASMLIWIITIILLFYGLYFIVVSLQLSKTK